LTLQAHHEAPLKQKQKGDTVEGNVFVATILVGLIRLIWKVVSSPTALAVLLAPLALLIGLVALQSTLG
jgi:hypothetical protein